MLIGVPKEIKTNENRIALVPAGAEALVAAGHQVLVERTGGEGSGFEDEAYTGVGAQLAPDAATVWAKADMIMKVKEPIEREWPHMRRGQVIFTYFHFAADERLTKAHLDSGATCIAYETVELPNRELPLLTPMSEVAGRMAVQEGARYLEKFHGGLGCLLGGVPGVLPAEVVILGGGVVGTNAAKIAAGFGAHVTILDINLDRLRAVDDLFHGRVITLMSNAFNIDQVLRRADILVGAVLVAGARAPVLVTRQMVATMKEGSVIVDVAVDQGGSIETIRPTTLLDPTYVVSGVVHYGVANMPALVPRTSTFALTNTTLPYVLALAEQGVVAAVRRDPALARGVNVWRGRLVHPAVAEALGEPVTPLETLLA
jgi:alanine dehydrogenase